MTNMNNLGELVINTDVDLFNTFNRFSLFKYEKNLVKN